MLRAKEPTSSIGEISVMRAGRALLRSDPPASAPPMISGRRRISTHESPARSHRATTTRRRRWRSTPTVPRIRSRKRAGRRPAASRRCQPYGHRAIEFLGLRLADDDDFPRTPDRVALEPRHAPRFHSPKPSHPTAQPLSAAPRRSCEESRQRRAPSSLRAISRPTGAIRERITHRHVEGTDLIPSLRHGRPPIVRPGHQTLKRKAIAKHRQHRLHTSPQRTLRRKNRNRRASSGALPDGAIKATSPCGASAAIQIVAARRSPVY